MQYTPKQIRVNAVLPGLMETPMVVKSTAGLAAAYGGEEETWKARARTSCPWASGVTPGTSRTLRSTSRATDALSHGMKLI